MKKSDVLVEIETIIGKTIKKFPLNELNDELNPVLGYASQSSGEVIGLSLLNLDAAKIKKISQYIKHFPNLSLLNLRSNKLVDISFIENSPNIEALNLNDNKITNLKSLRKLKKLRYLELYGNPVIDIGSLSELINLRIINLGQTLVESISSLKDLTNLEELYLHYCQVKDVSPIRNLKKLRIVNFNHNPIREIPSWITEFPIDIKWSNVTLKNSIVFYDNPLINPPIEIIKEGKNSISRYFARIKDEGLDFIYEAKITLVGDGSAGKTSLINRILDETSDLPKQENRTRGIKINDWTFNIHQGKFDTAHIWDFGGQDVYYPVHRFFLTENSVFVVLASSRQAHHNFDYWIPTIYQFGGNSPIILGQTCHDGNKVSWNDLGIYFSNPNFNVIKNQELPYTELNLPNGNEGLSRIKKTIIDQITSLPYYGKGVPSSWIPLRKILTQHSKDNACITFDKLVEICKQSNSDAFRKLIDVEDCAKFLHSIGIILWYSENPDLRNWVVLSPEWSMNAVYKIIDDAKIQKQRGIIAASDFQRLWSETHYEGKDTILKKMLEVFKIAFPKKHKNADYIIPARLISIPNNAKWNNNSPYLRLEFKYEFMPRGVVNQVSAELSRFITSDTEVWNNAVNFIDERKTSSCQVEEDFYFRKISIKAKGKDARGLIALVKNALQDITDGYKGVTPEIFVPCTCSICSERSSPILFSYDLLSRKMERKENAHVTCNESDEILSIEALLFNVGLQKPLKEQQLMKKNQPKQKKLFISYSKHDESYLKEFQKHLITLRKEGLQTFNCSEIEFGKEWDKEIRIQINECNVMVCLVSVDFLNTDYITRVEIQNAIKEGKIIIPIIIQACDWETSEIGKFQAAQRGKVVSLDNNDALLGIIKGNTKEERAAFWTAIIKEFRKKLFN